MSVGRLASAQRFDFAHFAQNRFRLLRKVRRLPHARNRRKLVDASRKRVHYVFRLQRVPLLVYVVVLRQFVALVVLRVVAPPLVFVPQVLQQPPLPQPRFEQPAPPNVGTHVAVPLFRRLFRLRIVVVLLPYAVRNAVLTRARNVQQVRRTFDARHIVLVVARRRLPVGATRLPMVGLKV